MTPAQHLAELRSLRAWAEANGMPAVAAEIDRRIDAVEHDDEARSRMAALGWIVLLAGFVTLVVATLMLFGCEAAERRPLMQRVLQDASGLTPALALRAAGDVSLVDQPATVHRRHMPQLAAVKGGLPVVLAQQRPVAGERWSVLWLTSYVAPRPDAQCALLVTLREPGPPAPIPGGRGAMLQVPPDYVLVPDPVGALGHRDDRPVDLQQAAGAVLLSVDWPVQLAGLSAWLQLLVADARVPAGCVSTPMVEIHVGRR